MMHFLVLGARNPSYKSQNAEKKSLNQVQSNEIDRFSKLLKTFPVSLQAQIVSMNF